METQRIEIRPGYFIDVSARLKKKAGVRGRLIRTKLTSEDRKSIMGSEIPAVRSSNRYSRLLLDEAVELSKSLGMKEAVRISGVKYWSIVGRKRVLAREGKYVPASGGNRKTRYTMEQKQRCVKLAKEIRAIKRIATDKAFIEAGKRLGVNGLSIWWMYHQGTIPA